MSENKVEKIKNIIKKELTKWEEVDELKDFLEVYIQEVCKHNKIIPVLDERGGVCSMCGLSEIEINKQEKNKEIEKIE